MANDRTRGATSVTSLADRVGAALRFVATGRAPAGWFGPGDAPTPQAPPESAGRQFDYPFAYNTGARPRSTEPITFAQLRSLADAHDLTRLAIETRKDQMERVAWTIARRDKQPGEPPPAAVEFFRAPDREHAWPTWLRMLLEEVFVPDAASLYLRRTRGGALYAAEIIDGTTVVPLLDETGRRPLAPAPAYQQILHGLPATNYTREELIYAPRNPRVHKVYGYSPVEQIVVTINIALRRQAQQLSRLDDTNIPPAIAAVPKEWSVEQIKAFQAYWDILTTGAHNVSERSKMKFVPGDVKAQLLSTEPLFGEAEEWLARIICWAFSLPPTSLVKQNNRATAETVQDAAQDEGLAPLMLYVKGIMDRLLQSPEGLGLAEWEWQWKTERPLEPTTQAAIDVSYINAGVRTARAVAMDRFGEYEAPEPVAAPPNDQTDDPNADEPTPPADEAAKAARGSLPRDWRWY